MPAASPSSMSRSSLLFAALPGRRRLFLVGRFQDLRQRIVGKPGFENRVENREVVGRAGKRHAAGTRQIGKAAHRRDASRLEKRRGAAGIDRQPGLAQGAGKAGQQIGRALLAAMPAGAALKSARPP